MFPQIVCFFFLNLRTLPTGIVCCQASGARDTLAAAFAAMAIGFAIERSCATACKIHAPHTRQTAPSLFKDKAKSSPMTVSEWP